MKQAPDNPTEIEEPVSPDAPQAESPRTTTEPTTPKETAKAKWWKSKRFLIGGGIVVLLAIIAVVLVLVHHHHTTPTTNQAATKAQAPKAVPLKENQFYSTAQKLNTDLAFFKDMTIFTGDCSNPQDETTCPPAGKSSDITYYRIGTTADNQPILVAYYDTQSIDGAYVYIAIEDHTNHYSILGQEDNSLYHAIKDTDGSKSYLASFKKALASNVTLDTTTVLQEFDFPSTTTIKQQPLKVSFSSGGPSGYFIDNGLASVRGSYYANSGAPAVTTKIASNGSQSYYNVTVRDEANYSVQEIYGLVGGVYAVPYVPVDTLVAADVAPRIIWTSGQNISDTYTFQSSGCGSATGYVIAKGIDASSLSPVGTGPSGQTLYALPSSSALFQEIYTDDYAKGDSIEDASLKNLSVADFQAQHAVFLAKNSLGEWVVYLRNQMFVRGGCGKPVVYLYPQVPTKVNVQVGATVTKSDPTYTAQGWQNVLALPGSTLLYQGHTYPSLFWEGAGDGPYPDVTSGSVVPQAAVVSTIRSQLKQQGLTTSEINDFLAFWQPRLPKTPYVRLTWFDTASLNVLAPLHITPTPNTVIRVFLDFQGLQQPVQLPPQHFIAPVRQGFTVVEWGGLLGGKQL